MDPLVPNQVRYQTAPHSDKSKIIARTDTFSVSGFPFFLHKRRRASFVCLVRMVMSAPAAAPPPWPTEVSTRPFRYRGIHVFAGNRCIDPVRLKMLAKKVQQNIGLRLAEAFPVSMTVA